MPAEPVSRTALPPARGSASPLHSSRSLPSEHRLVLSRRPSRKYAFYVRVKTVTIPLVKEHDGSEDAPFADVAVDSDCSNAFAGNFVEYAVLSRHRPRVAGIDPLEFEVPCPLLVPLSQPSRWRSPVASAAATISPAVIPASPSIAAAPNCEFLPTRHPVTGLFRE